MEHSGCDMGSISWWPLDGACQSDASTTVDSSAMSSGNHAGSLGASSSHAEGVPVRRSPNSAAGRAQEAKKKDAEIARVDVQVAEMLEKYKEREFTKLKKKASEELKTEKDKVLSEMRQAQVTQIDEERYRLREEFAAQTKELRRPKLVVDTEEYGVPSVKIDGCSSASDASDIPEAIMVESSDEDNMPMVHMGSAQSAHEAHSMPASVSSSGGRPSPSSLTRLTPVRRSNVRGPTLLTAHGTDGAPQPDLPCTPSAGSATMAASRKCTGEGLDQVRAPSKPRTASPILTFTQIPATPSMEACLRNAALLDSDIVLTVPSAIASTQTTATDTMSEAHHHDSHTKELTAERMHHEVTRAELHAARMQALLATERVRHEEMRAELSELRAQKAAQAEAWGWLEGGSTSQQFDLLLRHGPMESKTISPCKFPPSPIGMPQQGTPAGPDPVAEALAQVTTSLDGSLDDVFTQKRQLDDKFRSALEKQAHQIEEMARKLSEESARYEELADKLQNKSACVMTKSTSEGKLTHICPVDNNGVKLSPYMAFSPFQSVHEINVREPSQLADKLQNKSPCVISKSTSESSFCINSTTPQRLVPTARMALSPFQNACEFNLKDFKCNEHYTVKSLVTVRQGESLDSAIINELRPGSFVQILQFGEEDKRRVRVKSHASTGWISLVTKTGELLVG